MLFSELFTTLIADHSGLSAEEAGFVFAQFRAELKNQMTEPEILDKDLSEAEAKSMLKALRKHSGMMALISRAIAD